MVQREYSLIANPARRLFLHDVSVMDDPSFSRPPYGCFPGCWLERGLCMADNSDLLLVNKPIEPAYLNYFAQITGTLPQIYAPPDIEQLNNVTAALLDRPGWLDGLRDWLSVDPEPIELSFFTTSQTCTALHQQLTVAFPDHFDKDALHSNDPNQTNYFNRKATLRTWLPQAGVQPIPGITLTVGNHDTAGEQVWASIQDLLAQSGQVMVKTDKGCNGSGNLLVSADSYATLCAWLAENNYTDTFVAEAFIPAEISPNVQFFIDRLGNCHYLGTTIQRLSNELRFQGSSSCIDDLFKDELMEKSWQIAKHLAGQNVRGVVGLDFLCPPDKPVHFVEVNIRINGSTYAQALVDKINAARAKDHLPAFPAWQQLRVISSRLEDFEQLRDLASQSLMHSHTTPGVVPFVSRLLSGGIVNFVTVGSCMAEVEDIEARFISDTGAQIL